MPSGLLSYYFGSSHYHQPSLSSVFCAVNSDDRKQLLNESPTLGVAQRGANAKPQPQPSTDSTTRTPSSARFARKGLELSQSNDDDSATPLPPPELFSPRQSRSFFDHRSHRKQALSIDSIPRQTIMKSLASRPPLTALSIPTSGIHGSLSSREDDDLRPPPVTSRRLSQALSEINSDSKSLYAGKMATLASPLFFHEGFDDAVNINKVLEEIRDDEYMSHSRLMQTATGVREVAKQLQRRPIKRAVRNVMIITKARDNSLVSLTRELAEFLITTPRYGSQVGVNVYVDAKLRKSKRFDVPSLLAKDPRFEYMLRFWTPDMCWTSPEQFDLVLTLGGDGTVLFTSWLFQRIVPPVLSFSLGSLGFLTNFEYQTFRKSLNNLMGEEGMRVNLRMRFTCTVYRAVPGDPNSHIEAEQFEVLNELLIDRGPSPYISQLELYGDNNLLTVIQADGCIFSTPTGSTAYSLSAGGSLIHPDIPAILLTPICPHTLSFRPMLLNDTMLLRVAVPRNSRATAYCAFDGKGRVELRQGDHVTIAASKFPFPTVLSKPTEWFDSISTSLRWNTRGAAQKGWEEGNAEGDEEKFGSGFDIDIDDDDSADSGYSGGSSSAGDGVSPVKSL
ncbi:ATP-NAD kinase [Patellaria atrata CBS 101060]|uniref:ATP-NAD kinase n=1 Tax=Patellaria atrata CBS 101060 TaxID=1346257 RepID=A0A9P4SAQ3_9PEZI|nr:ATP-NAD kinase [Patellaria atrata CBS 101060]